MARDPAACLRVAPLCSPNAAEQVAAAGTVPGHLLPQRHDTGAVARYRLGFLVGPSHADDFRSQDPVGFGRGHHLEGRGQWPPGGGHLLHGYLLPCHGEPLRMEVTRRLTNLSDSVVLRVFESGVFAPRSHITYVWYNSLLWSNV